MAGCCRMRQPAMRDEANMTNQLFEAALGIKAPWYVQGVDFDTTKRQLTIAVDFVAGSRFSYAGVAGEHPVHDTQIKRLRHLNFFQPECFLEVRVPRVRLPDGSVRLVEPDWVGQLNSDAAVLDAEERRKLRQSRAKPVCDALYV